MVNENLPHIWLAGHQYAVDENGLVIIGNRKTVGPPKKDEIDAAVNWLTMPLMDDAAQGVPRYSSYFLKHVASRWAGVYISNGAFILAIWALSIKQVPMGLNTKVAIRKKWLDRHEKTLAKVERVLAEYRAERERER